VSARTARRGGYALAEIAVSILAFAPPGRPPGRAFPALHPAAAPPGWPHLALPDGTAVLSPPALAAAARRGHRRRLRRPAGPGRRVPALPQRHPRQGSERPPGWAAFRVRLLRSDDAASARQDATAEGVQFRGGTGSCVIDDYVTRIGGHHYKEVACLVQGRTGASVIVAAAPAARWARARPLLFRAVAAYLVR
jgi:hypothetical protein